jgi:hypothetical protein
MLQALKDFWTRNVVISNWEKINPFLSPIDYFRGTIGSVLSLKEVQKKITVDLHSDCAFKDQQKLKINSPYTLVSQKEASIENLKNEILLDISFLWAIPKESIPDLQYLLANWYLEKLDIEKACDEYFLKEWDSIINFLHKPKDCWDNLYYPNIGYDLWKEQRNIIAFLVSTKKITEKQLWSFHISLKRWCYDLEEFMEKYTDKDFFDTFVNNLMEWNRTYI